MKIVTATGYYATGSSAVTDLLQEYSGVKSLGSSFECRIAHDMFGISDLEYYLVDNFHRHNASTAIKNFERLMKIYGLDRNLRLENYPAFLGEHFAQCVDEYIKALAPMVYQGGSHTDLYMKSDKQILWLKLQNRIFKKLYKTVFTTDDTSYMRHKISPLEAARKKEMSYISYPREIFYTVTIDFTKKMFSRYESPDTRYLLVDQLIPPTNPMRYLKYFEDARVICVDRDPRDIYYLEKYYWQGGVVPSNIDEFIAWYKTTRMHKQYEQDDTQKVLRINFEDLITDYDNIVDRIEDFLRIDSADHRQQYTFLDPRKSINNIGKWRADSKEASNIRKIEREIPYNYL